MRSLTLRSARDASRRRRGRPHGLHRSGRHLWRTALPLVFAAVAGRRRRAGADGPVPWVRLPTADRVLAVSASLISQSTFAVVGETGGSGVRAQGRTRRGGRVELEAGCVMDRHAQTVVLGCDSAMGPISCSAHRRAFPARLRAPRRPSRRARNQVSTSVMSRTRSSSTSPSPATNTRRAPA